MSDFVWCHGPDCHTYSTVDRVRGNKGSKVLRTRKINRNNSNYISMYSYFCSQGCYNDFANKHAEQIIRIAPRPTPLETPIEDPKKTKHETSWGHTYTTTQINKIDNESNVG
jgi:YHS domain-containing protein